MGNQALRLDLIDFTAVERKADRFRGKRVRLSALLRLDNVESHGRGPARDTSGAALTLRVEGAGFSKLDDMRDRPLRGTKPWTEVSLELDVPVAASVIEVGAILTGSGTLWVDAFRLEVVEPGAEHADARQRQLTCAAD